MNYTDPGPLVLNSGQILISDHNYYVKLAESPVEIDAVLRLRFEVFNLELNQGYDHSFFNQRDMDEFDKQFHHLIAVDRKSGLIIGTYRIQTYEMAILGNGFYSAQQFEVKKLGWMRLLRSVELGRACISKNHRNGRVLFILWKAIFRYMQNFNKRYLFGCCSLSGTDPFKATLLLNQMIVEGYVHKNLLINPLPANRCFIKTLKNLDADMELPALMKIYFRYGAKVCSYPALDNDFKTTDYLVMLDLFELDKDTKNNFCNTDLKEVGEIKTG